MSAIARLAACMLLACAARGAEPAAVAEKDLVPDGTFAIKLPHGGTMAAKLPSNYARGRPLPVVCVYGGLNGDAFAAWSRIVAGADFIVLCVDLDAGGDPGLARMAAALKALEQATPVDRGSLVIADDGAASVVASQIDGDRVFCAAVLRGAELPDAHVVAGKALLVLANPEDAGTRADAQPPPGFERQLALYDGMRKAGGSAEIVIAKGDWAGAHAAAIRDWLHRAVPNPEIRRAYWIARQLDRTESEERQRWCWQRLAESWVETPRSGEARRKAIAPR